MQVSVREFKNHLAHYLGVAKEGRDVIVVSRGKPVVRLIAVEPPTQKKLAREEIVRRLRAIPGFYVGNGKKLRPSRNPIRIKPGEKTLAELVLEDRGPR